jgi:serine-type D-Ala-D-Ala carboxypeptidase/endopeptidase
MKKFHWLPLLSLLILAGCATQTRPTEIIIREPRARNAVNQEIPSDHLQNPSQQPSTPAVPVTVAPLPAVGVNTQKTLGNQLPTAAENPAPAAGNSIPAVATPATRTIPQAGPLSSDIDALVKAYMSSDSHVPGLAVGVIKKTANKSAVTSAGFYGVRSKDTSAKPDADTLFEIGSETKLFTATLLAFMVNNGQVKLDDPIQAYLPDGVHAPTYQGHPIRIVDLATHRSGLPDNPSNRRKDVRNLYTVQDMYDWLNSYKLTRAPGSQWEYSNIGFGLLGTILVRVDGTPYDQLITQYLGKPLNLPDTVQFPSPDQSTRLAVGYDEKGNPAIPVSQMEGGAANRETRVVGGGQLYSTLNDMFRFAAANLDLIGDENVTKAIDLTQQVFADGGKTCAKMGLGWQMGWGQDSSGARMLWKDGLTNGFHSYIALFNGKDVKYAVFLLGNGVKEDALEQLGFQIYKRLSGVNQ